MSHRPPVHSHDGAMSGPGCLHASPGTHAVPAPPHTPPCPRSHNLPLPHPPPRQYFVLFFQVFWSFLALVVVTFLPRAALANARHVFAQFLTASLVLMCTALNMDVRSVIWCAADGGGLGARRGCTS